MDDALWATAQDAERAFYRAFEQGDLEAMARVWDVTADVCCIHPMGKALVGAEAVLEGWRGLFSSGQRLRFEIRPLSWQAVGDLVVSVLQEHIFVAGERGPRPPMLATNVYRHTPGGWRMTLHHASPAVVEVVDGARPPRLH